MPRRKFALSALVVGFGFLTAVANAAVGDKGKGSVASEVVTKPTGPDGVRHSAESEWSEITVPEGHVIVEKKTNVIELSAAGSEHYPTVEYANYVEVTPGTGITQPRTIRVKTFCRGPKGHNSGRGWLRIRAVYETVQYK